MTECIITIVGPGGVINNELLVIEQALKRVGYDVTVKNDHPPKMGPEDHLQFVEGLQNKGTVEIIMNHCPWGG